MAKRGSLSREKIIAAAMILLDRDGEKGFSMRKLAGEMGVDPMALYHHHRNRDALMFEVMQALLDQMPLPEPSGNWEDDIRALCRSLRDLARRHPGAFRVYELFDDWVPAEQRMNEAFHATLLNAGFTPNQTVRAVRLIIAYTEAFAVDEITGWLAPYDEEDRTALRESLSDSEHPTLTTLFDKITTIDIEADFDFALDVMLAGLRAQKD